MNAWHLSNIAVNEAKNRETKYCSYMYLPNNVRINFKENRVTYTCDVCYAISYQLPLLCYSLASKFSLVNVTVDCCNWSSWSPQFDNLSTPHVFYKEHHDKCTKIILYKRWNTLILSIYIDCKVTMISIIDFTIKYINWWFTFWPSLCEETNAHY